MTKNIAESIRASTLGDAKENMCWRNAVDVIYGLSDYSQAAYVEGIVVKSRGFSFPQEHGWVEKDGEIIDPTLPELELVYFPALRWSGKLEILGMEGRLGGLPFWRTSEYTIKAVCSEIEDARRQAQEWLNTPRA